MGRAPCCSKIGLNRGAWTPAEDEILCNYIRSHGEGNWRRLPLKAGLKRCGKSCRLRWMNYLRPNIKRGNFSEEEDDLIVRLHSLLGNRWSLIAGRLPGRTDNEIKNYWNTHLSKNAQKDSAAGSPKAKKMCETRKENACPCPVKVTPIKPRVRNGSRADIDSSASASSRLRWQELLKSSSPSTSSSIAWLQQREEGFMNVEDLLILDDCHYENPNLTSVSFEPGSYETLNEWMDLESPCERQEGQDPANFFFPENNSSANLGF